MFQQKERENKRFKSGKIMCRHRYRWSGDGGEGKWSGGKGGQKRGEKEFKQKKSKGRENLRISRQSKIRFKVVENNQRKHECLVTAAIDQIINRDSFEIFKIETFSLDLLSV